MNLSLLGTNQNLAVESRFYFMPVYSLKIYIFQDKFFHCCCALLKNNKCFYLINGRGRQKSRHISISVHNDTMFSALLTVQNSWKIEKRMKVFFLGLKKVTKNKFRFYSCVRSRQVLAKSGENSAKWPWWVKIKKTKALRYKKGQKR